MVSNVSGMLKTASKYGGYGANFIFGTGSDTVGKYVKEAVSNRKTTGMNFGKSVFNGFTKGVQESNKEIAETGFFKSIKNAFSSLPKEISSGWSGANVANKSGISKFFTKLTGSLKPLSKVMPFAFNALILLSSVPSVVARTQDEGIWGGIKETGKAIGKLGMYALGSALGAAFGGIGAIAGVVVAGLTSDFIFGKDYSAEKEEKNKKSEALLLSSETYVNPYNYNEFDYLC